MNHLRSPLGFCRFADPLFLSSLRLIALGFLATTIGCSKRSPQIAMSQADTYASAIRDVLSQDKVAGEKCKEDAKKDRLAAYQTYVSALRQIDLRSCPHDFQEAFLKHKYAWSELVVLLEKYDGFSGDLLSLFEVGSAVLTNLSLTGEGDREIERARKSIASTNFELERVALRYKVQVDQ